MPLPSCDITLPKSIAMMSYIDGFTSDSVKLLHACLRPQQGELTNLGTNIKYFFDHHSWYITLEFKLERTHARSIVLIFALQTDIDLLQPTATIVEKVSILGRHFCQCLSGDVLIYSMVHGQGQCHVPSSVLSTGKEKNMYHSCNSYFYFSKSKRICAKQDKCGISQLA